MTLFKAALVGARSYRALIMLEMRDCSKIFAVLFSRLPHIQDRDDGVLPNCLNFKSCNWEVEEFRQEGNAVRSYVSKVEQGEPVRFSLEGDWNVWWRFRPLVDQLAQEKPVTLGLVALLEDSRRILHWSRAFRQMSRWMSRSSSLMAGTSGFTMWVVDDGWVAQL